MCSTPKLKLSDAPPLVVLARLTDDGQPSTVNFACRINDTTVRFIYGDANEGEGVPPGFDYSDFELACFDHEEVQRIDNPVLLEKVTSYLATIPL